MTVTVCELCRGYGVGKPCPRCAGAGITAPSPPDAGLRERLETARRLVVGAEIALARDGDFDAGTRLVIQAARLLSVREVPPWRGAEENMGRAVTVAVPDAERQSAAALRRCSGCGYWNSKPCGEGCALGRGNDPTWEEEAH